MRSFIEGAFCPPFLDPHVKNDAIVACLPQNNSVLSSNLTVGERTALMRAYLAQYAAKKNDEGLNHYIFNNLKNTREEIPDGSFVLSKPLRYGNDQWGAGFHCDGDTGFLLGFKHASGPQEYKDFRLWLAGVSFEEFNGKPLIVQLQAFKHVHQGLTLNEHEDQRRFEEIISKFRWEKLLVYMVGEFALSLHANRIYILPAEQNRWVQKPGHLPLERAKIRYDQTAIESGFSIDEESGYYASRLIAA